MIKQMIIRFISKLLFTALLVHLLWMPSLGLDPETSLERYLLDSWNKGDGLPSDTITVIDQTPDGFLWFTTNNGLIRFDGLTFKEIDHSPISPQTMAITKKGILWLGGKDGVTSYDYKKDKFTLYTSRDGFNGKNIRRIKEDVRGNIWIGLFDSVYRFSNNRFTSYGEEDGLEFKRVNTIIENHQAGTMLFTGKNGGLYQYKDGRFFPFDIPEAAGREIFSNLEDSHGALWIGTGYGLIYKFGDTSREYKQEHGLTDQRVICILEDSQHNLWLGTDTGLYRSTKNVDGTLTFENILPNEMILYLFEDKENSLWLGTYSSGLKRMRDGVFQTFTPLDGTLSKTNPVSLYEDSDGGLLVGTMDTSVHYFKGRREISVTRPPAHILPGNTNITAVTKDADGNLWLGTTSIGVVQIKDGKCKVFGPKEGLSDIIVTGILSDRYNNLWFATADGVSIYRWADGSIEIFNVDDGLSDRKTNNITRDRKGNIWIATQNGLTLLKNGRVGKEHAFLYLEGTDVSSVYEDPMPTSGCAGVYWITTCKHGLKRLSLKEDFKCTIASFTTAVGMPTDCLYLLCEDRLGNFWMTGDNGILRIGKDTLNSFTHSPGARLYPTVFGTAAGMPSSEFSNAYSRHALIKRDDGEVWFITGKGIAFTDPPKFHNNEIPPQVVIEEVTVDDRKIPHLEQEKTAYNDIKIIRFDFTAPTFLSPERVRFRYRLRDHEEWVYMPLGAKRNVQLKELQPGDYTFTVSACNAEGVWNPKGASFSFALVAPFYQTIFFKILLLAAVLLPGAAAYYVYKKRAEKTPIPVENPTPAPEPRKPGAGDKYKTINLDPIFAEECIQKLKSLMNEEMVYRDESLSLQSLAKKLGISAHKLSRLLNDYLKQSFSEYINGYRINEVKRILANPEMDGHKIALLAGDVGFNTTTAFYNSFKKYTGITPSEYKKKKREKK
ncbi:MAG: helix-turn-helix domain-containing protein [bacterium]|nr:helix-turn-helix domain-containing protein [bacterium]